MEEIQTHKTTINVPLDLYNDLKREARVLGINFNALLLIKLQEMQKQKDTLKLLQKALDTIEFSKNK